MGSFAEIIQISLVNPEAPTSQARGQASIQETHGNQACMGRKHTFKSRTAQSWGLCGSDFSPFFSSPGASGELLWPEPLSPPVHNGKRGDEQMQQQEESFSVPGTGLRRLAPAVWVAPREDQQGGCLSTYASHERDSHSWHAKTREARRMAAAGGTPDRAGLFADARLDLETP
jgi:hypothetical protein